MAERKSIPTYDLYKTLSKAVPFEFSLLENAYQPYNASLPHRHNYYEVLYFREGGGEHEIDFNTYPVQANSLHFVSPEQVHLLRREKHVTGFVISFAREFCIDGYGGISFPGSFPFFDNPYIAPVAKAERPADQEELLELFNRISTTYTSDRDDRDFILACNLSLLLVISRRLFGVHDEPGKKMNQRSELVRKFRQLVDQHYVQIKSVSEYSNLLHISSGHLNDTVQRETGKTASEIIYDRILLEAKRMLYHSQKSIKEIAFALNYDDPSYFIKFFKTHVHDTPEHFRISSREKYH